jgi:hypothetical protein
LTSICHQGSLSTRKTVLFKQTSLLLLVQLELVMKRASTQEANFLTGEDTRKHAELATRKQKHQVVELTSTTINYLRHLTTTPSFQVVQILTMNIANNGTHRATKEVRNRKESLR